MLQASLGLSKEQAEDIALAAQCYKADLKRLHVQRVDCLQHLNQARPSPLQLLAGLILSSNSAMCGTHTTVPLGLSANHNETEYSAKTRPCAVDAHLVAFHSDTDLPLCRAASTPRMAQPPATWRHLSANSFSCALWKTSVPLS